MVAGLVAQRLAAMAVLAVGAAILVLAVREHQGKDLRAVGLRAVVILAVAVAVGQAQ
jgi:hypothetical protein